MGIVTMRNRVTSEFRKADNESQEFEELKAERWHRDGRPVWEQTSHVDAAEQQERLESGAPLPEDLGDEDQPYSVTMGDAGVDTAPITRGRPTRAEAELGVGKGADDYEAPSVIGGATLRDVEDGQSDDGPDDGQDDQYAGMSKSDLKGEAESRGLTVERGDGSGGEPLVEDYQKALREDDNS